MQQPIQMAENQPVTENTRAAGFEHARPDGFLPVNFAQSRAYLIGVADYAHAPSLQTSVQDARALESLLREQHGFRTTLLTDPTKAEIEALFGQIRRENTAEDGRVLLYYAGHGVQQDSAYGLKGYFLPADAQPGNDDSKVPMAQCAGTTCCATCRPATCCSCSIAASPGPFAWPTAAPVSISAAAFFASTTRFQRFSSKIVLTSTSHRQKAFDRIEDNEENSPFNRFLRQALEGAADYTGDRLVTASELKTFLADSVSKITEYAGNLQSVGLDALDGDGEGEFLFFLDGFNATQLPKQAYVNPYKGLQSYEPGDTALFFGRHSLRRRCWQKPKPNHPLVVATGASGTGKSSLVKAGLLRRLAEKRIQIIRPGKNPLAALATARTGTCW